MMVDQRKMAKVMKKFTPVRSNIAQIGNEKLELPNYSGTKKFMKDRAEWDDLRTPASLVKVSADKPPVWTSYKSSQVLNFEDQAVNEQIIYFILQMPHAWKEGSNLKPHVHLVPEDNTAGNARFELTYSWANIYGVLPTATSETITIAMPEVTDKHGLYSFSEIDGTGKTISSMLLCSLTRKSADILDTYDGKGVYFLEVDFHYLVDSMGSKSELVK